MELNTTESAPFEGPATARILAGAAACFGRCGYRGASMSAIAREAGVAKSLLHYHFESKEQLFIDVQLGLFRGLLQRVRGLVGEGRGSMDRLGAAFEVVLDDLQSDQGRARMLLEFREVGDASRERVRAFYAEVEALIAEGIQNTLGPATDGLKMSPERIARQLLVFFQGALVELAFVESPEDLQRVREAFHDHAEMLQQSLWMGMEARGRSS